MRVASDISVAVYETSDFVILIKNKPATKRGIVARMFVAYSSTPERAREFHRLLGDELFIPLSEAFKALARCASGPNLFNFRRVAARYLHVARW